MKNVEEEFGLFAWEWCLARVWFLFQCARYLFRCVFFAWVGVVAFVRSSLLVCVDVVPVRCILLCYGRCPSVESSCVGVVYCL